MNNPYKELNNQNNILTGLDMMGDNIRNKIAYIGEGVVLYPLCKMIRAEHAKIENCAVNSENNGSSGGNQVGGINASSKITYDITSSNKQTVSLKLRIIIAGSDRLLLAKSFVLKVNNSAVRPNPIRRKDNHCSSIHQRTCVIRLFSIVSMLSK